MPNDPSISLHIRNTHRLILGGVTEAHDAGDTGAVADAVGNYQPTLPNDTVITFDQHYTRIRIKVSHA
jgi:hypothetical protein